MNSILELLMRVFSDTSPAQPADFAFLFGQTVDNQESVLKRSQLLLENSMTQKIGFLQSPALSGYPGFDAWYQLLVSRNVTPVQMEGIPFDNPEMIHTRIEAKSMILHAKQQRYTSVCIVAAPFHQLRAFMTAVTVAREYYPGVRLYSVPGTPLPWLEQVAHSQGKIIGTRRELITGEYERIEKYIQQGDLATVAQVIEYLNQRDN